MGRIHESLKYIMLTKIAILCLTRKHGSKEQINLYKFMYPILKKFSVRWGNIKNRDIDRKNSVSVDFVEFLSMARISICDENILQNLEF